MSKFNDDDLYLVDLNDSVIKQFGSKSHTATEFRYGKLKNPDGARYVKGLRLNGELADIERQAEYFAPIQASEFDCGAASNV